MARHVGAHTDESASPRPSYLEEGTEEEMMATALDRTVPLAPAAADEVAALGTVVGVWAHPDDETFLSAGLMALARAAGHRVVCVTATRGEAGTDDPVRWPPERLGPVRVRELEAGLRHLGGVEHRWLGLGHRDGQCADAERQPATAAVAAILDEVRPDTVVTFGVTGFTGHPDHQAVGRWAAAARDRVLPAARLLHPVPTAGFAEGFRHLHERFSVFYPGHPVVAADDGLALDLRLAGPALDGKVAALRAQPSQTTRLIAGAGEDVFRSWWARETFVDGRL